MFLKQRLLSSPFEKKDEMIVFVDNKRIEMGFKIRGWKVYIYIYIYSGSYNKTKERMQLCRQ